MHFELELKTLLNTLKTDEQRSFYDNEMERFAALFGRFLQEEGPSVEWDKIQKLPANAVQDYTTLIAPKDESTVSWFHFWFYYFGIAIYFVSKQKIWLCNWNFENWKFD